MRSPGMFTYETVWYWARDGSSWERVGVERDESECLRKMGGEGGVERA